ncbi:unnamed protein product, partial [Amoebophrya sp. A120]|eukprot:GSA120T00002459001.1
MGIPKFFRWLRERYPAIEEPLAQGERPAIHMPSIIRYDNLYVDMNGLIHTAVAACKQELATLCAASDEEDHMVYHETCAAVDRLVQLIEPQQVLFLAVDGVAPTAKMNQQRERRYRAAWERLHAEADANSFDSNWITPGTPFLFEFGRYLQRFVAAKCEHDPIYQRLEVIVSTAEQPGEGEHKLADFLRQEKRLLQGTGRRKTHCMYGLDADLIMLSLMIHEPRFSLLRERQHFDRGEISEWNPAWQSEERRNEFVLVHIGLLREYLEFEFSPKYARDRALLNPTEVDRFNTDHGGVAKDEDSASEETDKPSGATMSSSTEQQETTRAGDDVASGVLAASDEKDALKMASGLPDGASSSSTGKMKTTQPLKGSAVEETTRTEKAEQRSSSLLPSTSANGKDHVGDNNNHNDKQDRAVFERSVQGSSLEMDHYAAAAFDLERVIDDFVLLNMLIGNDFLPAVPYVDVHDGDLGEILRLYRDFLFAGFEESAKMKLAIPVETTSAVATSSSGARREAAKKGTKAPLGQGDGQRSRTLLSETSPEHDPIAQPIARVCEEYCEGLLWTLKYYYRGVAEAGWMYAYPHHYAPFLCDLLASPFLQSGGVADMKFRIGKPVEPFEQLCRVLPYLDAPLASAVGVLPREYLELMARETQFFPKSLVIDTDGMKTPWGGTVRLPLVDPDALQTLLKK